MRVLSKVSSNLLQFASPHLCHNSVSFQLFFMKVAPLESSHYPLFNHIKWHHPKGLSIDESALKSLIQSPPIVLPPFVSYLSEFSVVFRKNCTIGKLTLSSIQLHRATSSIRPSPLTRVLSKVSSNILQFASPYLCHISVSFQLFFMKIAPLESSGYPLFNRIEQRHPLGRLCWRECSQKSNPISSNSPPPICVISQWVFSCFSWKLHH